MTSPGVIDMEDVRYCSSDPQYDSKFRRRTSNHNLTVDIEAARRAQQGGLLGGPATSTDSGENDTGGRPTMDRVQQEGRELFLNFVSEEKDRRGLRVPSDVVTPLSNNSPSVFKDNPMWAKAGRELREIADEFSRTKERQRLRQIASSIDTDQVDRNHLWQLLSSECSTEVSRSQLVTVFLLATDIVLRPLEQNDGQAFSKLLNWSLAYIHTELSPMVYECGGYVAVVLKRRHILSILAFGLPLIISLIIFYIRSKTVN